MALSSTKSSDAELSVSRPNSSDKRDDLALARLGKKAVLKVCIPFFIVLIEYIADGRNSVDLGFCPS